MAWTVPDTRPSILLRLQDPTDHEAWSVFESIYRVAIVRAARFRGLQDADADDVAQAVLERLTRRNWEFSPDAHGARFRTWLARVTENAIIDHGRKRRRSLDTVSLDESSAGAERIGESLELEYRREVFQWAAAIVRREYSHEAWQSFWLTAVENRTVEEVASELNRSVGSIYTSRSRIMRRLKEQVSQFDNTMDAAL